MSHQRLFERLSRSTQPRIGGVQRNLEDLGDFRHRQLVELGHHEHFAFGLVDPFQKRKKKLDLGVLLDEVERSPRLRLCIGLNRQSRP